MKRFSYLAAVGAMLLTASSGVITSGASAATTTAPGEHCGVMAETGALACFTTIDQVEDWAAVTATSPSPTPSKGIAALAAGASGSYLQGIFYEKNNKTGDTLSIYGDGACDSSSDWDYAVPKFSAFGWNDEISSFQGYSNCQIKLFENANYNSATAGATYGPVTSTNYVGDAMNDKASSARFY